MFYSRNNYLTSKLTITKMGVSNSSIPYKLSVINLFSDLIIHLLHIAKKQRNEGISHSYCQNINAFFVSADDTYDVPSGKSNQKPHGPVRKRLCAARLSHL